MIIILSPSKTLNTNPVKTAVTTQPVFLSSAQELVAQIRQVSKAELAKWMKISPKLTQLTWDRFQDWKTPFTSRNATPALYMYQGEAYAGLDAGTFTQKDVAFAQAHLRILSGLYGVLKPLDLIQAYRLEMSAALPGSEKNLLQFWREAITTELNRAIRHDPQSQAGLVNLASTEYSKSILRKKLEAPIITPVFKEKKGGTVRIVGTYAKKARGMMTRFIIQQQLEKMESIKAFREGNYRYEERLSTDAEWVFVR